MTISTADICELFPHLIVEAIGTHREAGEIAGADDYPASALIFVGSEQLAENVAAAPPAVLVTSQPIADKIGPLPDTTVLITPDVRLAQARVSQEFQEYPFRDEEWDEIHSSAVIHESARLGVGTSVGPGAVIGARVKIGEGCRIRANAVIEHDAVIGDHSIVHSLVNVGYNCRVGSRVILKPGCILGAEGFGFARDAEHRYQRIPQTGNVEIEDDVSIGANSTVDRATYGSTILRRGCKIDALCHIAHNVEIGEDSVFAALSGLAGSSKIGKRVLASGQTGITDHVTVGDEVVLVHRAGVIEDLTEPGMYGGGPTKPFRDYVKTLGVSKKLAKLEQRIKELEARLSEQPDGGGSAAGD